MRALRSGLGLVLLATTACFPTFDDRPWLVEETRVLAVRSAPGEALPSTAVTLEALVVSPDGPVVSPTQWSYCTRPRRVEERTAVTQSCLDGDDLAELGSPAVIPADACARFGPNPPPVEGDEVPLRPADPDPTGGYYLPVRALVVDGAAELTISFGGVRIHCDLVGVRREVFDAYQERYVYNESPTVVAVALSRPDQGIVAMPDRDMADWPQTTDALGSASAAIRVSAGETLELLAALAPNAAEAYVVYRPNESRLVDARENLHISWFVTGGELEAAEEHLAGSKVGGSVSTTWHAPDLVGDVYGWVVVRDDRGGTAWSSFVLHVV